MRKRRIIVADRTIPAQGSVTQALVKNLYLKIIHLFYKLTTIPGVMQP